MTPQEIFDKAYISLMDQGAKSETPDGSCKYRSEVGACAVGHLIPDSVAELWDGYDDTSIETILSRKVKGIKPWMNQNIDLLTDIQMAHDSATNPFMQSFQKAMEKIAKEYGLKVPSYDNA